MTSLIKHGGTTLIILASAVLLAGCGHSSTSPASQSNTNGGDTSSAMFQKECQAMLPIFSDPKTPAESKDPEKIINGMKNGAGWGLMTAEQQKDAAAGIRKAATGSCK